MPAWPSQNRSALEEEYPVLPPMPCNLFTVPDGSRTDKPLHFSVKNMVPFGRKAMSHGNSSLFTATSVVRTGAAASTLPDAANPAAIQAALNPLVTFILFSNMCLRQSRHATIKPCKLLGVSNSRKIVTALSLRMPTHRDGHGLFAIDVTSRGRGDRPRGQLGKERCCDAGNLR